MRPTRTAPLRLARRSVLKLGTASAALFCLAGAVAAEEGDPAEVIKAHGYSNFGTLKYPAEIEHLDYVNPDAPKGGEISVWSQGNFDSFNQYAREGVPAALNTIGSESLLTSTADDPYGLYCLLCTSLEYPRDRSWVIFNLRRDVTFQDGSLMTAADVEFSNTLFMTQGILEYRTLVQNFFKSVEVLDDYRIKFTFQPDSSVRDRIGMAGGTPVFSKAWFEKTGARLDKSTKEPFMSTGAYVLDSFDFNRRVIYKRNPAYWGEKLPINRGRNNFDRIRVEYFADSSAAFEGFKSADYTFRTESRAQLWAEGYNFPNITNGYVTKEEVQDGSVGTRLSWVFNLDRPQWQDKRVREAVGLMFNFAWTNKTIFYDLYKQPVSYWSGTDLAATGTPGDAERALLQPLVDQGLIDAAILTEPAEMPETHQADANQPDRRMVRQAMKLLQEAGYESGQDGVLKKDGKPLELVIIQYDPTYDRIVNPFIANLQLLGLQARLERVDTAQYVQRRREGNFDLANQAFAMDFEPSLGLVQWYGSSTAQNSSRNLMRLANPAVDKLIDNVVAADDLDSMKTGVHALDRALRFLQFDIPLWYNDKTFVAYYNMYKHPDTLPPLSVGEYDFWWYDQAAADKLKSQGVLR